MFTVSLLSFYLDEEFGKRSWRGHLINSINDLIYPSSLKRDSKIYLERKGVVLNGVKRCPR